VTPQGLGESRLDGARVSQDAGGGPVVAARCAIWRLDAATAEARTWCSHGRGRFGAPSVAAGRLAGARADDASDDDGGDSDEDSLPDPDMVVASEDDE
jgi:hypothetical protein